MMSCNIIIIIRRMVKVCARDVMFAFQVVSNQKLFTFGAALNGILHRILAYFSIKQTNSLFIIVFICIHNSVGNQSTWR